MIELDEDFVKCLEDFEWNEKHDVVYAMIAANMYAPAIADKTASDLSEWFKAYVAGIEWSEQHDKIYKQLTNSCI